MLSAADTAVGFLLSEVRSAFFLCLALSQTLLVHRGFEAMAEGSSTYNVSVAAEAKEVHMPGSGAGAAPVPAASGAWQETWILLDLAS